MRDRPYIPSTTLLSVGIIILKSSAKDYVALEKSHVLLMMLFIISSFEKVVRNVLDLNSRVDARVVTICKGPVKM